MCVKYFWEGLSLPQDLPSVPLWRRCTSLGSYNFSPTNFRALQRARKPLTPGEFPLDGPARRLGASKNVQSALVGLMNKIKNYNFSLSFMWSANEQDSPVPSGSTLIAFTTPSSNNIEYLIDRVPPIAGISVVNSMALVNMACGSDNRRTYAKTATAPNRGV